MNIKKQRVIGIRHTLRKIKDEGLISENTYYPDDAVDQLKKTRFKANSARRHRPARSSAPVDSIVRKIEEVFDLPSGSVKLQYPSGRKARRDTTIAHLRRRWESE